MTERLFLEDAALREAPATVLSAGTSGIVLYRTPFYARAGGQPGDTGVLRWDDLETVVIEAVKGEGGSILHLVTGTAVLPALGTPVQAVLDWPRRHALMRMHTALHLLCSLLPGAAVTGGQIGAERSRLDFDLPAAPDKETLEDGFRRLIAAAHPVTTEWVDNRTTRNAILPLERYAALSLASYRGFARLHAAGPLRPLGDLAGAVAELVPAFLEYACRRGSHQGQSRLFPEISGTRLYPAGDHHCHQPVRQGQGGVLRPGTDAGRGRRARG